MTGVTTRRGSVPGPFHSGVAYTQSWCLCVLSLVSLSAAAEENVHVSGLNRGGPVWVIVKACREWWSRTPDRRKSVGQMGPASRMAELFCLHTNICLLHHRESI